MYLATFRKVITLIKLHFKMKFYSKLISPDKTTSRDCGNKYFIWHSTLFRSRNSRKHGVPVWTIAFGSRLFLKFGASIVLKDPIGSSLFHAIRLFGSPYSFCHSNLWIKMSYDFNKSKFKFILSHLKWRNIFLVFPTELSGYCSYCDIQIIPN